MRNTAKVLAGAASVTGAGAAHTPAARADNLLACTLVGMATVLVAQDTLESDPGTVCTINGSAPSASHIVSRGRVVMPVCGTGTWYGDQTIPSSTPRDTMITIGGLVEIDDIKYTIGFFAGVGLLRVSQVERQPELAGDDVDGIVAIRPAAGSSCTGPPGVSNFEVTGWFTVVW